MKFADIMIGQSAREVRWYKLPSRPILIRSQTKELWSPYRHQTEGWCVDSDQRSIDARI